MRYLVYIRYLWGSINNIKESFGLLGIQLPEKYKDNFDVSSEGRCSGSWLRDHQAIIGRKYWRGTNFDVFLMFSHLPLETCSGRKFTSQKAKLFPKNSGRHFPLFDKTIPARMQDNFLPPLLLVLVSLSKRRLYQLQERHLKIAGSNYFWRQFAS
jgi:hypothetical protein